MDGETHGRLPSVTMQESAGTTNLDGEPPCTQCIVCHDDIDIVRDCGLFPRCGNHTHWQCESCQEILAEHCAICDRGVINNIRPCTTCGERIALFQSRACANCEALCCVGCSKPAGCCRPKCLHVFCPDCDDFVESESESD